VQSKSNYNIFYPPVCVFNSGLYHTYIIIVHIMGSQIVHILKLLDLYKLAWRWLQRGRNM